MAADRFLAVCFPVESMTLRNTSNTTVALAITYTAIVLSQIPVAQIHDIYEYDFIVETRSTCAIVRIATAEASVTEVNYENRFPVLSVLFTTERRTMLLSEAIQIVLSNRTS